jgi:hypothetical protein
MFFFSKSKFTPTLKTFFPRPVHGIAYCGVCRHNTYKLVSARRQKVKIIILSVPIPTPQRLLTALVASASFAPTRPQETYFSGEFWPYPPKNRFLKRILALIKGWRNRFF